MLYLNCSTVIAGQLMAQLFKFPDTFLAIRNEGLANIVLSLILLMVTLLFFSFKLYKEKLKGLIRLEYQASTLCGHFENEWVNDLLIK